jgi:hypothetical protein
MIQITSPKHIKLLQRLAREELESILTIPASEKNERCYQREWDTAYGLAELSGVKLGKFPKKLGATAEEIEYEGKPTDPAVVQKHRELMIKHAQSTIDRLSKLDTAGAL